MTTTTATSPEAFTPKARAADERRAKISFLGPLVAFLAALSIFPTIFALVVSFTDYKLGTSTELHFVGLKNYSTILTSGPMLQTFGRTFLLLVVVLPIQLILGYLVAKVFYRVRDVPGAGLIRTLYLLPVMLPEIVVGLLFGYMLNPRVGVVNYYLGQLGLPKPDWFGSTSFAMVTIMLLIIWQWTPLATVLLFGGLLGIPAEIREAAQLDGAGAVRHAISIEIPLLRKVIGLVVLLAGIQLVGTFAIVYITTQGGPGTTTNVLSFELYRQAFVYFNTGYGAALSMITLVIVTILSQVLVRAVFKESK